MEYTIGDIYLHNVYGVSKILGLNIMQRPNSHPIAKVKYMMEACMDIEKFKRDIDSNLIKILFRKGKNEKVVFCGYVHEVIIKEQETGERFVFLELYAASILLDQQIKNRSFQNVSCTYQDVISCVIEENGQGVLKWNEISSHAIGMPVIQFNETNWTFVQRMASMSNSCMIVDMEQEKPLIHVGKPDIDKNEVIEKEIYQVGFSDKFTKDGGTKRGKRTTDYLYYKVVSAKAFKLGETVDFKGKKMYVYEKEIRIFEECVRYHYLLVYKDYFLVNEIYNDHFIGHTIIGTVLETNSETLKLDLHLEDDAHDNSHAYPYDWKPETGNFSYVMPKSGSEVSLYFPDNQESSAMVINCIRKNGTTSPKMENTQNKRFTTEHNKVMDLDMDQLYFSTSDKDPFAMLKLIDDKAIRFQTKGFIKINAKEKIEFKNARVITMSAYGMFSLNEEIQAQKNLMLARAMSVGTVCSNFSPVLSALMLALEASGMPSKAYFNINYDAFNLSGKEAKVTMLACCKYPRIMDAPKIIEKEFPWKKFVIGIGGVVLGTAGVCLIAGFCFAAAPIAIVGAAIAGVVAGGFAVYNMADEERKSVKEYSWQQYLGDGLFQSSFNAATALIPGEGITGFLVNTGSTGISTLVENQILKKEWSDNLGANVLYSGIWFIGTSELEKIGGGVKDLIIKRIMKKVNDNPSSILVKIFSVAKKDNKYLTDKAYTNAEEAEKIFKDADIALAKLRKARKDGWSDSARKQANSENKIAQQKKSQFILNEKKNKTIVKAEKAIQDSLARKYATATGIFDSGYSLGDNASNNALNKTGTKLTGYPVNWIKDKLENTNQENTNQEKTNTMKDILEKENEVLEECKPTWDLCTGLKGFVEEEKTFKNGVIFKGME